jgi:acyl-coenzyme A thioesterase PaaI-like protein
LLGSNDAVDLRKGCQSAPFPFSALWATQGAMMNRAYAFADWLGAPRGDNLLLRLLGRFLIPSLGFVRARIDEINDARISVRIPLRRRTKNHLGSMYFAVLAAGADTAAGFLALHHIRKVDPEVVLIFKDFKAEFLRRVDGDALFICEAGEAIAAAVAEAADSGERVNVKAPLVCLIRGQESRGPAAVFELTVSLKKKRS